MQKINHLRRITWALAMAAMFAVAPSVAHADVLSQVPADAAIVVKLNHVSESNHKLGAMLTQLGITDFAPTMKDPLQAAMGSGNMGPGLDLKGDAAFYLTGDVLGEGMQHADEHGVVLLPVSDYAAFIGSQTKVRDEGDTTVVHFNNNEKDMFVQRWGEYAAISATKETLAIKHTGLTASGLSAKALTDDDLVFYFNFEVIKKSLLPALDKGETDFVETVEGQLNDDGQKKVAAAAVKQLVQMGREFLNDANGCVIGVTITDKGIKTCVATDFTADSYLGKLASTLKMSDGSMVAGLPKARYMACGGFVYDPAWTVKLFDDLVAPILKQAPSMGEDGRKITDAIALGHDLAMSTKGGTFEAIVPTEAGRAGIAEVFILKGDAAKMKACQSKLMDWTAPMMNSMFQMMPPMMGGGAGGADLFKMTATPNFETIDDISFDKYALSIDPNNTSQMAMQMSQSFSMMYGPDGMNFIWGQVDDKTLAGGMGLSDTLLKDAIESAKSNQDVLGDSLKEIDAQLPAKRAGVEYFSVSNYLSFIVKTMKAAGMPLNVSIPANVPPMGITVGATGSSLRFDVYVPQSMLQTCIQAGMQGYMQMMGGGKNQGGL